MIKKSKIDGLNVVNVNGSPRKITILRCRTYE